MFYHTKKHPVPKSNLSPWIITTRSPLPASGSSCSSRVLSVESQAGCLRVCFSLSTASLGSLCGVAWGRAWSCAWLSDFSACGCFYNTPASSFSLIVFFFLSLAGSCFVAQVDLVTSCFHVSQVLGTHLALDVPPTHPQPPHWGLNSGPHDC
jgi:hypothetical protein